MQKKLWIGLEGMEFHAYHGVYDEERVNGGKYIVDVFVYTDAKQAELYDQLSGTINYEKLYEIVNREMQEPAKLLEHLGRNIIDGIRMVISKDDKIRLKICKLNPPLKGKVAASVVEMEDGSN
jgi:dihydroneopterin aldolase